MKKFRQKIKMRSLGRKEKVYTGEARPKKMIRYPVVTLPGSLFPEVYDKEPGEGCRVVAELKVLNKGIDEYNPDKPKEVRVEFRAAAPLSPKKPGTSKLKSKPLYENADIY